MYIIITDILMFLISIAIAVNIIIISIIITINVITIGIIVVFVKYTWRIC